MFIFYIHVNIYPCEGPGFFLKILYVKVRLSNFEDDFVGVFFQFLGVLLEFIELFVIGLYFGWGGLKLGCWLLENYELADYFFEMVVEVVLLGEGRRGGDYF